MGATHYLFTGADILSIDFFPWSWLGVKGAMHQTAGDAWGGGTAQIFEAIVRGEPTVILKHTGRGSDFWSYVYEAVMDDKNTTVEDVLTSLTTAKPFWYGSTEGENELYDVGGL